MSYLPPDAFSLHLVGHCSAPASQGWRCVFDYYPLAGVSPLGSDADCTALATSFFTSPLVDAFMGCLGSQVTLDGTEIRAVSHLEDVLFGYYNSSVPRHGLLLPLPMTSFGCCSVIARNAAVADRHGRGRVRVPYAYVTSLDNRLTDDCLAALGVLAFQMMGHVSITGVDFSPVLISRSDFAVSPIVETIVRPRAYNLRTRVRPRT